MKVLDTIEVTVEYGGEELTLDVEITRWATRATHDHPGDPAEWVFSDWTLGQMQARLRGHFWPVHDAINDQVQEHCTERAAPR